MKSGLINAAWFNLYSCVMPLQNQDNCLQARVGWTAHSEPGHSSGSEQKGSSYCQLIQPMVSCPPVCLAQRAYHCSTPKWRQRHFIYWKVLHMQTTAKAIFRPDCSNMQAIQTLVKAKGTYQDHASNYTVKEKMSILVVCQRWGTVFVTETFFFIPRCASKTNNPNPTVSQHQQAVHTELISQN